MACRLNERMQRWVSRFDALSVVATTAPRHYGAAAAELPPRRIADEHELWVSDSPVQDYTDRTQLCHTGNASSLWVELVLPCKANGRFMRLIKKEIAIFI